MKYASALSFVALLVLLSLPMQSTAQELPYKEGTVWEVTFVKTVPGMSNDYLKNLAANWRNENEEAKKQGLILSYKILSGSAANKDDWDLLLMIEYKNMAALDGIDEKWNPIDVKIVGSPEQQKVGYTKRNEMREILGSKIVREITLK
jgi:hypothetical protein